MMEHVCDCGWMVYTDRPIPCGRCGRTVGDRTAKPFPIWAAMVRALAKPNDIGVGDTVDRILWYAGGEIYKRLYRKIRGKQCGCQSRREKLNRKYLY